MATDIFGIGFTTADKIAEYIGITTDFQIKAEVDVAINNKKRKTCFKVN